MQVALHYVRTDKCIYTPGEIIPDGVLTEEMVARLALRGAIRVEKDEIAPGAEQEKESEYAFEPVETDYEAETEELPAVMEAQEAVIPPKKGGKKKC